MSRRNVDIEDIVESVIVDPKKISDLYKEIEEKDNQIGFLTPISKRLMGESVTEIILKNCQIVYSPPRTREDKEENNAYCYYNLPEPHDDIEVSIFVDDNEENRIIKKEIQSMSDEILRLKNVIEIQKKTGLFSFLFGNT